MSEQRKLATIMAVDVAGYSRAAEADDRAAAEAVSRVRAAIDEAIAPNGGRVFNTAGDGFMVELPAASSGVAAAQALLALVRERSLPRLRIGVHLGDVMAAPGGDLLGHGVNVAARLMQMAEPNTAVVSHAVQAQLRKAASVHLRPLGRVQLDKMSERVEVFAIADADTRFARIAWRRSRMPLFAFAGALVFAIAGFFIWRGMQPPQTPRLAVLRFENLGDTEQYFSEGVADELISEVSRIQGIEVSGRASSFSLTGANATPANAARQLGATLVLTGSVRRLPDRVRVNAELVEAPGGRSLWSQTFERPSNEAFLLERAIAIRVAQAADARVSAPPPRRVDPEAYRLYLQGREEQLGVASTGWTPVRDRYREAVDRDPHFAEAWAALARAEANVAGEHLDEQPGGAFTDAVLAPALADADRAIALDNSLADPFLLRALVHAWLGHWQLAAGAVAQAERRGGSAGNFYRAVGAMQKAEDARRDSVTLDPLSATELTNLAYTCEYTGDAACQLDAAQRAHDLAPQDVSATRGLVRALVANDRKDDAYQLLQTSHWLENPTVATRDLIGMTGHGPSPSTNEILNSVNQGQIYVDNGITYLADAGRWDVATMLIGRWGPSERSTIFTLFRAQWAPLRRAPQFWALMEREGLVQYWRTSGHWPDFCAREPVCDSHRRR
ncbi:MAG: adenylate/guanylate cyclase domain-containing protein [Vitreimonas sp.]